MENHRHPTSLRLSDEDKEILEYLIDRLGLKPAGVIRLALRRLYQAERKRE